MPPLPRGLILLASLWLFASWIGSMGVHPPLLVATSSYTPSVRVMMLASAAGALVAWPMLRLSQPASPAPIRAVLLDLAVVVGMLNMVLWPLRLVTPWPVPRMAALMLLLTIWIIAAGAFVSIGWRSRRAAVRTLCMVACVAIAAGAMPLRLIGAAWLPAFPSVHGGPFEATLALATPGGAPPTTQAWSAVEAAAGVALLLWAAALVIAALSRRRRAAGLPRPASTDTLAAWN